jgi:UDPglucose 6-dehydrogenase
MCKYAANAYLATRITFINQIANLCEVNGANVLEVIKGIGLDERIGGHYWYPGLGYGGSCFPKDVKELAAYAKAVGHADNLMVTISELNEARIGNLMNAFSKKVGGFSGKRVAVLGLSFKPNTDDMREAPALKVVPTLIEQGATVRAYDPMASEVARTTFARMNMVEGDAFRIVPNVQDAVRDADIVMLLVEWNEFISLEPRTIAQLAKPNAVLIDTRDQYDPSLVHKAGLTYIGIGL